MAIEHSPAEAAQRLGIALPTLRKWSQHFAILLSPPAAASGPRARRRYSESDIAILRHVAALLDQGNTYAETLAALAGDAPPAEPPAPPIVGEVTVIQPGDEGRALAQLVEAQRAMLLAQQQHIEVQQALISQLQAQSEYDRAALDRARADEGRALEALRATLAKVPRWLRGLLGLGS